MSAEPTAPPNVMTVMRRWRARYDEAVAGLRRREFTGYSESDLVRAVVSGVGELRELTITDRALEYLSDETLSEYLAAAIMAARTAARGATPAADGAPVDQARPHSEPSQAAGGTAAGTPTAPSPARASATDPDELCTVRVDAAGTVLAVSLSDDAYDLADDELAEAVHLAATAAHRLAASSPAHRPATP